MLAWINGIVGDWLTDRWVGQPRVHTKAASTLYARRSTGTLPNAPRYAHTYHNPVMRAPSNDTRHVSPGLLVDHVFLSLFFFYLVHALSLSLFSSCSLSQCLTLMPAFTVSLSIYVLPPTLSLHLLLFLCVLCVGGTKRRSGGGGEGLREAKQMQRNTLPSRR